MELCNTVVISGIVKKIYPLHYSPAGVCVYRFVLDHKSTRKESNAYRQVNLSLFCLILDAKENQMNQIVEGEFVELSGFLNQNMKQQLVMHVSSIKNLKG